MRHSRWKLLAQGTQRHKMHTEAYRILYDFEIAVLDVGFVTNVAFVKLEVWSCSWWNTWRQIQLYEFSRWLYVHQLDSPKCQQRHGFTMFTMIVAVFPLETGGYNMISINLEFKAAMFWIRQAAPKVWFQSNLWIWILVGSLVVVVQRHWYWSGGTIDYVNVPKCIKIPTVTFTIYYDCWAL